MHYLTAFSIMRDEKNYVNDFVDFHKHMGVDHFVIMDHGSVDPIRDMFKGDPKVTVIDFPKWQVHAEAWQHATTYYRNFTKWGMFIDCDQFFTPKHTKDIKVFLEEFEKDPQLAGVQVNWHTVGNSGHETKPKENQLLAFNKRAADDAGVNGHTQTIGIMNRIEPIRWHNPHMAPPMKGFHNVGTDHNVLTHTPFNVPIKHDKASIYHLYTRSKEEFIHKQKRGRADIIGEHLDMSTYETYNAFCNEVEDNTLADIYKEMNK